MKYTIEGFSQKKLIDMSLDVSDALILRWFMDFSATGSMKSVINDGKTYFLVRYEGIIRDIPLLGISSTKGIANRFNKYVELGLMERLIRRGGNNSGCSIFFMATQKLLFLSYEKTDVNEHVQEAKRNTREEKSDSNENTSRTSRDSNHTSCRTSPTGTPVAIATGTPVAIALNNSSTKNSSTTSSSPPEKKTEEEVVVEIKTAIKKLFGSEKVFSADFIPLLLKFSARHRCSDMSGYINFVYNKLRSYDVKNFTGYFYKSTLSDYMMESFILLKSEAEKKVAKQKTICPVCGTEHEDYKNCDVCGLMWNDRKNPRAVFYAKSLIGLEPDKRKELENELYAFASQCMTNQIFDSKIITQQEELIYKKFGIDYKHN